MFGEVIYLYLGVVTSSPEILIYYTNHEKIYYEGINSFCFFFDVSLLRPIDAE